MSPAKQDFPADFVWGAATSAFQIEGAARADGKGESIWDRFCTRPGAIADASDAQVACDHYHRLDEDLALLDTLGVDAYRFSISWPRVQPEGKGRWNAAGLDFYERLVDGLLARGLQAHATLNHWDLPQALQDEDGWANRDTVHRFVDYSLAVQRRLGDRLAAVCTHNEPWVVAMLGHRNGLFAPGQKNETLAWQVAHHLLTSHGLALRALRQEGAKAELGIVLNLSPMHPATDSAADRNKAQLEDGKLLRWHLDAMCYGRYPADVLEALGSMAPLIEDGDLAAIQTPLDFLGVNYYSRSVISSEQPWDAVEHGMPVTDMGWEVYPQGLTELLLRLQREYPQLPPVYITESGAAFRDVISDGSVHDEARMRYLQQHIQAVRKAMQQGARVRGYMVWSLLDNFEWVFGYTKRFGIVHVDFETQRRTLKDSALWYRDFLKGNN